MSAALHEQAKRFHRVFAELVRAYQFRDRDQISCRGLSISQCYTLETLEMHGPLAMGELAGCLQLEISTMTRVVDYLVANNLAARGADPQDRRVCRVRITRKGRTLVSRIQADLIEEYEQVLQRVPQQSREAVILAVSHLLSAFKERQSCGSARPEVTGPKRRIQ